MHDLGMKKTDDVLMKLYFQSHVNLIAHLVVVYVKTVHIIMVIMSIVQYAAIDTLCQAVAISNNTYNIL